RSAKRKTNKKANQRNLTKQKPHPKREKGHGKKQQTKTTKHTIEFSNNTPRPAAPSSAAISR
ncbi:hypothetical protein, partial [Mycolicibacterium thermoresistibile]